MRRYTTVGVDQALANLAGTLDDLAARTNGHDTSLAAVRDDLATLRADLSAHTRALTVLSHALRTGPNGTGVQAGPTNGQAASTPPGRPDTSARAGGPYAQPDGPDGSDQPESTGRSESADEPDGPPEPPAPSWLTVEDPAVAVAWLNALTVWVPRVWQPYLPTGPTPACWPWHPPVVAELLVVAHLWDDAIAAAPDPAPLAGWHDRWRPGAAHRIARHMAGCERAEGRHKIAEVEYHYDLAFADELAVWWATTHGTDPDQPAPGMTVAGRTR